MRYIYSVPDSPFEGDPAWLDLEFDITDAREISRPDKLLIEALADTGEEIAGIGVEYDRSNWRRDQVSEDVWFDFGRGAIFSLGPESDALACLLKKAIANGGPARFIDRVETDVVLINSDPAAMLTEPCRSKFFFGDNADREAQIFVNFDLPSRVAVVREKDLDYRANLLRALVVQ